MTATDRAMRRLQQFTAALHAGQGAAAEEYRREFNLMLLEIKDEGLRHVLLGWATLWAHQSTAEAVREIRDEVAEHRRRVEAALARLDK